MTRPADINIADEILSLKFYLSLAFPSDEIRHYRPDEDEPYTMLIEPPEAILANARGKYMSERSMPMVVQRWCDDYLTAVAYVEGLLRLFRKGIAPGNRSRIPVWKWDSPTDAPNILTDVPDRFLKVSDLEGRVLPGEKVGTHVAIVDVRVNGWRIDHTFTDNMFPPVKFGEAP